MSVQGTDHRPPRAKSPVQISVTVDAALLKEVDR